jgi:hypothetical protein
VEKKFLKFPSDFLMTIYELSVISTTGFPYYNLKLNSVPKGVRLYLRFFDFSEEKNDRIPSDLSLEFDLKAGLISALYEFAKSIDKSIKLLEFKTKDVNNSIIGHNESERGNYQGDVLITITTEPFLLHKSVEKKIELIYDIIISSKIPLDSAYEILANEEDIITDILADKKAHEIINKNSKDLEDIGSEFLEEMEKYGLKGICITSFDLSPLKIFSNYLKFKDFNQILRHIGFIPEIPPYQWIYRISFLDEEPLWVYIIKSGVGPTIHNSLFETYFYLLIADPQSYLAEFPKKVIDEFNKILG